MKNGTRRWCVADTPTIKPVIPLQLKGTLKKRHAAVAGISLALPFVITLSLHAPSYAASPDKSVPTAFLELRSADSIAWGKPIAGLTIGVGRIRALRGAHSHLVIDSYLRNGGEAEIQGIIQSPSQFVIEVDGRYFAQASFGGPTSYFPPGRQYGPVTILSSGYHEIKALRAYSSVEATAPSPVVSPGQHKLRIHYQFDRALVASEEIAIDVPALTDHEEDAIPLLAALVEDRRNPDQLLALDALAEFPTDAAAAAMARGLKSEDMDVRRKAALALGNTKSKIAVEALAVALKDNDEYVPAYAAASLGAIGDRAAIPALKGCVDHPHVRTRLDAVTALVKLGEPLNVEWVIPIIRSKEGNEFQNAIWLVRRHAGKDAVPTLIKCMELENPSVNNYYNYTLVWQIRACGGPDLKYIFDFDRSGSNEEVEENQKTLSTLRDWLGKPAKN